MGKLLFAVAVAIASFIVAESLVCNSCSFSLFGKCMSAGNTTCTGDNSTCFTTKATFPVLGTFGGFVLQGCGVNKSDCSSVTTGRFLTASYDFNTTCCNATDRCNTVTINAAPSSKMALSAAIGASILVFMFSM